MFQSFEVRTRPQDGPPRLAALRETMAAEGVDGYLVPRADMHQGEYVSAHDDRLAWLTGFTGSAGFAAILPNIAGVFVDGRYRLQVRAQTDQEVFTPVDWPETKLADWLKQHAPSGAVIGFDPWLHTVREVEDLSAKLASSGRELKSCPNLVDRIWADQPAPPVGKVYCQLPEYAGESRAEKRPRIAADLAKAGHGAAVLTLPDSISWLLNIRGADIPRIPIVQSLAILFDDGRVDLFLDPAKVEGEDLALGDGVAVKPPEGFVPALEALSGTVRVDRDSAPQAVVDHLAKGSAEAVFERDPCILPKACKNAAEIAGTREAHLRDGAAMVEFLSWLDAQNAADLTEIDVATALEGFRQATGALRDISFETICGTGPNGAIVHYRVTEETNRRITPGDLLLVDSGGQYVDGTTDITRTMATGTPPPGAVAAFTRVLKGMIAVSRARWPRGLAGRDLDALARAPLWRAGQDYDHGTGHGVGVFLSVHEGPQRLSRVSETPLLPGMILSNEPGYYREGAFGIRIENLVVVQEASTPEDGDPTRQMLGFETLTFVPIDLRLVEVADLSPGERDWLNGYHALVAEGIGPRVSDSARDWLIRATRAI
ncbi:MAG: aminopeptidase P family protein [Dinoroseobacter sp.]|nr:aminopeptidase P family protein [Dinoroseobacter sp.]